MSLVNNIDKAFRDNIASNYEGLTFNTNGVFINLNGLNIALLDKDCKVVDNRLNELSEPIRRELSGVHSDSVSLMKAFVARANQEINSFFVQIAQSMIESLKAKVAAEKKIIAIYEQRKMVDFLQDTSFKNKGQNKHIEIDSHLSQIGINLNAKYDQDPEISLLIQELVDCKAKHKNAWAKFDTFLTIMKVMMELTTKVERSKNANAILKSNALNNLRLVNEITYDDMQNLDTNIKPLDTEAQKKLLSTTLSKAELLQLIK